MWHTARLQDQYARGLQAKARKRGAACYIAVEEEPKAQVYRMATAVPSSLRVFTSDVISFKAACRKSMNGVAVHMDPSCHSKTRTSMSWAPARACINL